MTLMEKLFEKHMIMNKVKELQTENAELRECLRELIEEVECGQDCNNCKNKECSIIKAKAALRRNAEIR